VVTDLDLRAERLILHRIRAAFPDHRIIAEEAGVLGAADAAWTWLVDPLDGTKEFLGRRDEFTINIARIESGVPVLGVVYAPALGRLFAAEPGMAFVQDADGQRAICARSIPAEGATVVSSRSHGDPEALKRFETDRRIKDSITVGSSLKFCLVAVGQADGGVAIWDLEKARAALAEIGVRVPSTTRRPLERLMTWPISRPGSTSSRGRPAQPLRGSLWRKPWRFDSPFGIPSIATFALSSRTWPVSAGFLSRPATPAFNLSVYEDTAAPGEHFRLPARRRRPCPFQELPEGNAGRRDRHHRGAGRPPPDPATRRLGPARGRRHSPCVPPAGGRLGSTDPSGRRIPRARPCYSGRLGGTSR